MTKKIKFFLFALVSLSLVSASAQDLKIKGVYQNNRYDDHADHWYSTYVGWNSTLGCAIFVVENGIYAFDGNGINNLSPYKDPAVNISDFFSGGTFTDNDKAMWANNFNLMYGNSGAVYVNGKITTVTSRTDSDVPASERFAVRKWDAVTGDLLSGKNDYYPESMCLESAGMCYNPVDGKVYGLFYMTAQDLPEEIVNDPDYFVEQDDAASAEDAGYCICSIDLETMQITPITPGLYYYNFVTFAINSEGRAFAMTSGGVNGVMREDGKMEDINGNLTGATLCEFDLSTGLMLTTPVQMVDPETGETYIEEVNKYTHGTGYCSQYRRQSACFSKNNPNKMYWNGYFNSGKGYNDSGVWTNLPDNNWIQNGKYDTSLYEVDITTGDAERIGNFENRYTFACMWVDGQDASDGGNSYLRGDVNGDGEVDVRDITALIDVIMNSITNNPRADVSEDGEIDVRDITALIDIIMNS